MVTLTIKHSVAKIFFATDIFLLGKRISLHQTKISLVLLSADRVSFLIIIKTINAPVNTLITNNHMRQTRLPTEWLTSAEENSSSSSSFEEEKAPGNRAVPLKWTRVKSLEQIRSQKIMIFDGQKDLQFDKNQKTLRDELNHNRGSFVFDPDDFKEESQSFAVESYRLP